MEIDISALKNSMNGGNKSWEKDKKKSRNTNDSPERQGGGNHGNQHGNNHASGYVGAPYNFVSVWDVYEYPEGKQTKHSDMKDKLYTGRITYTIEAKTPIIVDDGSGKDGNSGEFMKDARGNYAIPGSTMRGLFRGNVQILGLSGLGDDIDDYVLMYREVAAGGLKDYYNKILGVDEMDNGKSISVLQKVKAGYLHNDNGDYTIGQTAVDSIDKEKLGEMNYYVLSERTVIESYIKDKASFSFEFFDPKNRGGKNILQNVWGVEFTKEQDKKGKVHYVQYDPKTRDKINNREYKPYFYRISYELSGTRKVTAVGEPGKYSRSGFVMSTGKMQEKKVVYIIPEEDKDKERIPIQESDISDFRIDYENKKNTLKQFDNGNGFFRLPEEGKSKPVFYIHLKGKLYFGFTPRLRLFFDNSVKTGLNKKQNTGRIDYAKAIFGYAGKESSYKSKVSFSDAVLAGEGEPVDERRYILAGPKPTSYLNYLRQDSGKTVTYNDDGFSIRGVKQYWLHQKEEKPEDYDPGKAKVYSRFKPLKEGCRFMGTVRFQNMTADELGLLVWSIRLRDNAELNVGKAKAFGYGRIAICDVKVECVDYEAAYRSEGLNLNPLKPLDADELIQGYKDEINKSLNGRKIDALPHIEDFFRMKDASNMPDGEAIRYMSIRDREFQNQKRDGVPLPDVKKVFGRQKRNDLS